MRRLKGFTLIELITVMVVISIVAAISTQFIVTSVNSYSTAKSANNLVNYGRTSIEQIARYLRSAVPNSIRASASGNCLEVMPSVGGAFYESQVADSENGASSTSSVVTSAFSLDIGSGEYVVIGALDSSEIYGGGALVSLGATTGSPITSVSFSTPHQFIRNSVTQRIYIGDQPKRFCVSGGSLLIYENYGLDTSTLTDANPGGDSVLLASGAAAVGNAFSVSAGTENRSASVDIALNFSDGNTSVDLQQTVLVRNVP